MYQMMPVEFDPLSGHPNVDGTEWNLVRKHVDFVSRALMGSEFKGRAKTGFAYNDVCEIGGKRYYFSKSNAFHEIANGLWEGVAKRYPERFGNENAYEVLDAFDEFQPLFPNLSKLKDFFTDDTCCYIVEVTAQGITNRTLRVDLFRKISTNDAGGDDFIGGLFHANKHFVINDHPLSTNRKGHPLRSIPEQLCLICQVFYQGRFKHDGRNKYTVVGPFDDEYDLKIGLYNDDAKNLEIFFINTVHVQKKL